MAMSLQYQLYLCSYFLESLQVKIFLSFTDSQEFRFLCIVFCLTPRYVILTLIFAELLQ